MKKTKQMSLFSKQFQFKLGCITKTKIIIFLTFYASLCQTGEKQVTQKAFLSTVSMSDDRLMRFLHFNREINRFVR